MTDTPTATRAPRRIKEMAPAAITAALTTDPRLLVPAGTCEQHGPHLPLGADTIIVEYLADDLSAEFGILRAPTLEYGVNAATEHVAVGNASLRRKTLLRALNDLVDCWEEEGVREFVLLTAHGYQGHQEALATVVTKRARVRLVDIMAVRMDDILETQSEARHGDEADTSLLLYIAPELVDMSSVQDFSISPTAERRYRRHTLRIPRTSAGSIGTPSFASAEKGEALYRRIRERVCERIFVTPAQE
jgi:creatinine amidohydrolase